MATAILRNVIGFDDSPPDPAGRVRVCGAVYCDERLDGVVSTFIERDGTDATAALAALVSETRFDAHVGAIFLQGATMGGFNVIDVHRLADATGRGVVVVCRKAPDRRAVREALRAHFPDGEQRWAALARLDEPRPMDHVWVQWRGLEEASVRATLRHHCRYGHLPEPLRVAHLIARGAVSGESRGRA